MVIELFHNHTKKKKKNHLVATIYWHKWKDKPLTFVSAKNHS